MAFKYFTMAPGILTEETTVLSKIHGNAQASEPIKPNGSLEKFEYEEVTPIIGREFPKLK